MSGTRSTRAATSASCVASDATGKTAHPHFAVRIQSSRLYDDDSFVGIPEMNRLLHNDLLNRVSEVGDGIAADLFPDEAFGFPINDQFVKNFCGSFISPGKLIDPDNFKTETESSIFLNRMVSTIAHFLHSTGKTSLVPLRYFTDACANIPIPGGPTKVKPDVIALRLIDGYIREGSVQWKDVKSIIELTQEKTPPTRMAKTVSAKSYMTFCNQPDRDFVPFFCITGKGVHIVVTDHVGQIETDVIPFDRTATTLIFFRMVMGLAFLPDYYLGLDATITRWDGGARGDGKFTDVYPPFPYKVDNPRIQLFLPDSSIPPNPISPLTTSNYNGATCDSGIVSISINSTTYQVIRLLFRAQTLIGRATRVFLVKLPDGTTGVLKDSWIASDRPSEADFLRGLDIPFGPQLVDHCNLRNTTTFRDNPIKLSLIQGSREKRRILTTPAGVHISDFSSLWELMVALLDVVVALLYLETKQKLHRDISYTNILLREPGVDSDAKKTVRKNFMETLGLSDIEKLREELKCREGLLIDFDYGAPISVETTGVEQNCEADEIDETCERVDEGYQVVPEDVNLASQSVGEETQDSYIAPAPTPNDRNPVDPSGARTGTAPFIAIELLIHGSTHRVSHDLESVLYVLLFICTHLEGPRRKVANPPLYGGDKKSHHRSSMRLWVETSNFTALGHTKFSHMISHFDDILSSISPYFYPLKEHIKDFWKTLIPQRENMASDGKRVVHSTATPQDIINVLKAALEDEKLISAHRSPEAMTVLGKRAVPGDLVAARTGWDPAKASRRLRTADPKLTPRPSRRSKFMEKN